MLNATQACLVWSNWRVMGVIAVVVVGLIVCLGLPSLAIATGIAPVPLIIACLVSCLIPLVVVGNKSNKASKGEVLPLVEK